MRLLLGAIVAAAALWSGYWFIGASAQERGVSAWLDRRAAAGWVADARSVETRGFPNRFDTTLTELELADPEGGLAWSAPFLQLLRLSYQRSHVIAIFPKTQVIATPAQRVNVTSGDAKVSFVFRPGDTMELDRANLSASSLGLVSDAGWTASLGDLRAALRPSERYDGATDIAIEARDLRPASALLAELSEAGLVPGALELVAVDASVYFDAPLDRRVLEAARPGVTEIRLAKAQMIWGELELWAAGDVTVSEAGLLTGGVTIKAKNWRQMLDLAKAGGWLPEAVAGPLESGLELLAMLSGSKQTLDAPLTFKDGKMSFGPIPLGPAPRIYLR